MLAVLPHGICVDPETVKLVTIRVERAKGPQGPIRFTVVMKTDADDNYAIIASFEDRAEAEKLSVECARRINKSLGEEVDDDAGGGGAADDDDDDW